MKGHHIAWMGCRIFLLFVLIALSAPVFAQTPTAKGNLGDPETEATQQSWLLDCGETEGISQGRCRILQTVVLRESRRPLLTAAIERRPGGAGRSLVLKVPHGILLPPGMALEVAGMERQVLRFRLSDATGVFAATVVSDKMLDALKKGYRLKVSVVTASGQKLGVPVSLRGFTAAFKEMNAKL